ALRGAEFRPIVGHRYLERNLIVATNTIDFDKIKQLSQLPEAAAERNFATDFPSVKDQVSPEEWQARVDLAACYRLVDLYDMSSLFSQPNPTRGPRPRA